MNALRTFALAVMLLVVVLPTTGAAKTPDDDPSERMVAAINEIRAKHGLAPLRVAPKLIRTSTSHARSVIRTDSFSHGSNYRSAGFRTAGEAMSYNRGWSVRTGPAIRMWLDSPGHRALVLSRSFRYAGAGIARGNFGGAPTTIWVAQFGAK
jgi:uncharacterized protein YkwD